MVIGLSEFRAAMAKVAADTDAASKAIITEASALITKEAKANFSGRHKKGQPHMGGAQPNVVSGKLRRSIKRSKVKKTADGWTSTVKPALIYAKRIETLGYPYFTPAVKDSEAAVQAIAKKRYSAAIGKW